MKRLAGAMTLLPFAMLLSGAVSADTFLEASVVDYGDNFRGGNLYAEQTLSGDYSASLSVYDDPEYSSAYLGIARMIGNFQLGLGLGEAESAGQSSFGYNPTLWYQRDAWEGFAEYEYLQDDSEGYYYRGYLHKDVSEHFYAGVYAERWVGTGPLVGVKAVDGGLELRAYLAKPLINRGETDVQVNLILSYGF